MKTQIHEAMSLVLRDIHRLKKGDKNDHGKYTYVSVDDVKDHVRPLLSERGLHISINELSFDLVGVESRNGITTSARITFAITLRHISGEELPADVITILLPFTGAQTAPKTSIDFSPEFFRVRCTYSLCGDTYATSR